MSLDEIARLEQEARELQEKLAAINAHKLQLVQAEEQRKLDEERRRELEKHVTITVTALSGGSLVTEAPYRSDLVDYFKTVPGRTFAGYGYTAEKVGRNAFPIKVWDEVHERLTHMPNVTIEWAEGVKEQYHWYLTAPKVHVSHNSANFIIKFGPNVNHYTYNLSSIPGAEWDYQTSEWVVPHIEGWRIYSVFEEVDGVVYDESAKEILFQQVEQRAQIDLIAVKTDSDFVTHIGSHPLRPFQRVGVEFLAATGGRAILADDTGLGKTWQFLAYAEHLRSETDDPFQVLIVTRPSLLPNIKREIERLTGEKPHVCLTGTPLPWDAQRLMLERVPYTIISYDTLGTYKLLSDDGVLHSKRKQGVEGEIQYLWPNLFNGVGFGMVVYDEAHAIKNPQAHRTKATLSLDTPPHVVPVTASPIMNRTDELWTLLRLVQPNLFKNYQAFLSNYTDGRGRPTNVKRLHEFLRPHFLRRTKAEVLPDLPPINRIQRFVEISPDVRATYETALRGIYEQLRIFDPTGRGGNRMNIMSMLAQLTRLKQITAAGKVDTTTELATELIDESQRDDSKVLIFTHYMGTAAAIARQLGSQAVCTVVADGTDFKSLNAQERDTLFEEARNNPRVRYVVTTEAAREGHNLEFCDWVIFNDLFWTPGSHYQCEGRAYGRLSDPHPIDSYYMVADVDFERWLMELLDAKLSIFEEVVEGVEADRDVTVNTATALISKMRESMWSANG